MACKSERDDIVHSPCVYIKAISFGGAGLRDFRANAKWNFHQKTRGLNRLSTSTSRKEGVVQDALRIASVLNKHMDENNCEHSVKEITEEIFEE